MRECAVVGPYLGNESQPRRHATARLKGHHSGSRWFLVFEERREARHRDHSMPERARPNARWTRRPSGAFLGVGRRLAWNNQSGTFLIMRRASIAEDASIARTIRFPASLRHRIAADADRCGRSFEAHVLALLRRHFGEDVDIAAAPADILALASASLADVPAADLHSLTRKLKATDR